MKRALKIPKKPNKYRAEKVIYDGIKFDSKIEGRYYLAYRDDVKRGKIRELVPHPFFVIVMNGIKICKVILDFMYVDNKTNKIHYIDIKGLDTAISRLKRKLVEAQYGIKVEVIKK